MNAAPPKTESLLTFPCAFPIKTMGRRTEGFAQAVVDVVLHHAPDFDGATDEMRASSAGNYLSVAATITGSLANASTAGARAFRVYVAFPRNAMKAMASAIPVQANQRATRGVATTSSPQARSRWWAMASFR